MFCSIINVFAIIVFLLILYLYSSIMQLINIEIVYKDSNDNITIVDTPSNLSLLSIFQGTSNVLTYSITDTLYRINLKKVAKNMLIKKTAYVLHNDIYYQWVPSDNDKSACLVYEEYDATIELYRPGRICINGKPTPAQIDVN